MSHDPHIFKNNIGQLPAFQIKNKTVGLLTKLQTSVQTTQTWKPANSVAWRKPFFSSTTSFNEHRSNDRHTTDIGTFQLTLLLSSNNRLLIDNSQNIIALFYLWWWWVRCCDARQLIVATEFAVGCGLCGRSKRK